MQTRPLAYIRSVSSPLHSHCHHIAKTLDDVILLRRSDFVLGGGSITDAVKAVALCLANPDIDSIDGLESTWVKQSIDVTVLQNIPIDSVKIKPASIKMI